MKIIKSNWAKKLIIILIVLMIFNIVIPKQAQAWDLMGILGKPIYAGCLATLVVTDTTLGLLLTGLSASTDGLAAIVDIITLNPDAWANNTNSFLSKLFIGPDTIFSGRVTMLNANIFDRLDGADSNLSDIEEDDNFFEAFQKAGESAGGLLKEISEHLDQGSNMVGKTAQAVARVYVILRNLCALIMLAGLIFTGIKILLSSNNPQKKNDWLIHLQDWIIGMGLLIFSHIIMILIFEVSDALVNSLSGSLIGFGGMNFTLMTKCLHSFHNAEQFICIILLTYLLWLTIIFAIAYFKRFFWVCILIVFAPIFSIMYAFGRQTKSIYTNWLKEFILTVFIQPFHLIVYSVLISLPLGISGAETFRLDSTTHIIYALIAMSFIRPAEKYLRSLFGMDKGIAAMASYDSGKQTFDAAKQAVQKVAQVAATVVKAYATGGASLGKDLAGKAANSGDALATLGKGDKNGPGGLLQDGLGNNSSLTSGLEANALGEQNELDNIPESGQYGELPDQSDEGMKEAIAEGMSRSMLQSGENMNAANVTITAGNVEMQGRLGESSTENIEKIESSIAAALGEGEEDKEGFEIDTNETFLDKMLRGVDIARNLGLGSEIYKGAHSLMDTLYVDAPSGDWKKTAENIDAKRKERVETLKDNWAHNKENIKIMTDKYLPSFMEEAKKMYKGMDAGFIEGKAREKAEEKAKRAVKDMSAYVPYGITDVNKAYELYKDANDYGYTPEQSIKQSAAFEKFNTNTQNIAHINQQYNVDCKTITEVIPNAKEYYNQGYTNISDMSWVNYMAEKLGKSPQFAIKVDQELKKKARGGKINYNGKNKEMADIVKQLNEHYQG